MKVLIINGSPRQKGNTSIALAEIAKTLGEEGIDSEIVWIGNKPVRGCIALLSIIQRSFYSNGGNIAGKPAAAVAVCRRGGASAAFETLNLPFQMMNLPVIGSQYWNIVYGREPGQAALDQ